MCKTTGSTVESMGKVCGETLGCTQRSRVITTALRINGQLSDNFTSVVRTVFHRPLTPVISDVFHGIHRTNYNKQQSKERKGVIV